MTITNQNTIEDFDWEFYNYALDLEKEWRSSLQRFSDKELLEIFPEAREYLEYRLKVLEMNFYWLNSKIRCDLKNIYKNIKDPFALWFNEEIVRVWKGETLNWLGREISKLEWLLYPKEIKGRITETQIEQARNYPFKELVDTRKDFILCPFHKEKRPSFCIRRNFGYCFSCQWSGDTIKFLMEKDGLTFPEAVKKLT